VTLVASGTVASAVGVVSAMIFGPALVLGGFAYLGRVLRGYQ
jgi:hypothetical protein